MQSQVKFPAAAMLVVLLLTMAGGAKPVSAQVPDVTGWQLSWQDEFDGPSVNTTNWNRINLKNSHNNELQYYREEQASIVDGNLRITATNQPLDGKPYRSARLESKQKFPMGRFEARIDLPTTQGMWPAFWLLPNGVQWPTAGEIDILENRGSQPLLVSSAYHWQTNPGPCCGQHEYVFEEYTAEVDDVDVNFHSGFHVYALEWEPTQLRFYVDGVLHYTVNETGGRPIFESPMNIILNLAVGGLFGGDPDGTTVFPQTMDVDYVRVWQKQAGVAGDYNSNGEVDGADFTAWRDSLGQAGIDLPADGSGNGTVGPEDYDVWKTNFGQTEPEGAGASGSNVVPEPATLIPMGVGLMFLCAQRVSQSAPTRSGIRRNHG